MKLSEAGYRERAFFKSWLLNIYGTDKGIEIWSRERDRAIYSGKFDRVFWPCDRGERSQEVRWEGSRSLEIMQDHGLNDGDCINTD